MSIYPPDRSFSGDPLWLTAGEGSGPWPTALTGAGEQLGNLFALRHVLDGSIDLLPDGHHQALPLQVAMPPVHQPVYVRNSQVTVLPFAQLRYDSG